MKQNSISSAGAAADSSTTAQVTTSSHNRSKPHVGGSTVKPNCKRHLKDVEGIYDMSKLAELIGDLHYQTLTELLVELAKKIDADATKDYNGGREKLAAALQNLSNSIFESSVRSDLAWKISRPFMNHENERM